METNPFEYCRTRSLTACCVIGAAALHPAHLQSWPLPLSGAQDAAAGAPRGHRGHQGAGEGAKEAESGVSQEGSGESRQGPSAQIQIL